MSAGNQSLSLTTQAGSQSATRADVTLRAPPSKLQDKCQEVRGCDSRCPRRSLACGRACLQQKPKANCSTRPLLLPTPAVSHSSRAVRTAQTTCTEPLKRAPNGGPYIVSDECTATPSLRPAINCRDPTSTRLLLGKRSDNRGGQKCSEATSTTNHGPIRSYGNRGAVAQGFLVGSSRVTRAPSSRLRCCQNLRLQSDVLAMEGDHSCTSGGQPCRSGTKVPAASRGLLPARRSSSAAATIQMNLRRLLKWPQCPMTSSWACLVQLQLSLQEDSQVLLDGGFIRREDDLGMLLPVSLDTFH